MRSGSCAGIWCRQHGTCVAHPEAIRDVERECSTNPPDGGCDADDAVLNMFKDEILNPQVITFAIEQTMAAYDAKIGHQVMRRARRNFGTSRPSCPGS
jgi:hypothetical protein